MVSSMQEWNRFPTTRRSDPCYISKMQEPPSESLPPIDRLRAIVAALRVPGGCPWDFEQTHASLRAGLLEEAYEVVAAIDSGDDANLCEELGDLLLQVVFHADIGRTEGRFDFDAVARSIGEKLVRRHPHVFGDSHCANSSEVLKRWDEIKHAEKGGVPQSLLDGLPHGLPALIRAEKVQKRAAKIGFDWSDAEPVWEKVQEELREARSAAPENLEEEIGDVLFAVVNLSRKLKIDPETALSRGTRKFEERFREVETLARERGLDLSALGLQGLDRLWDEVKRKSSIY
jgi:tetrapyrrole methylase family protein/MazG family protein